MRALAQIVNALSVIVKIAKQKIVRATNVNVPNVIAANKKSPIGAFFSLASSVRVRAAFCVCVFPHRGQKELQ
jgi:hypothetical protein